MHANLYTSGRGIFLSATDEEALQAALHISKTEGIIPALETAHAFAVLGRLNLKETDRVVLCLSGRGDKDLATYIKELKLVD
jgi:tryptophan synthase beta chain